LFVAVVSGALSLIATSSPAVQVPTRSSGTSTVLGDLPRAQSVAPNAAEWAAAPEIEVSRRTGPSAKRCETRLVREWLRVRCASLRVSAITQLGGSGEGARLRLDPKSADGLPAGGELVFPVRPGESRVFSFWTLGEGYDGPLTVLPALVVQSEWSGERPVIVLHDALDEPVRTAQSERRRQQKTKPPNPPTNP
jgi:hypothetical protein